MTIPTILNHRITLVLIQRDWLNQMLTVSANRKLERLTGSIGAALMFKEINIVGNAVVILFA